MTNKTILFIIIAVSFVVSAYFYPQFPDRIASHWNYQGQVDGYMQKFWGLFLMPIISVIMLLMFLAIPKIDPLKENIKKFRKYFDWFIILIFLFLLYTHVLTVIWNAGRIFNMSFAMVPAMGLLFFYAGILIENAKRNFFIGIRTPWTLSNDIVWDKTHKLGGKLFKASAIISFIGLLFPAYAIWFVLIPVICFSIYLVGYSYFEYIKNKKNKCVKTG